MHWLPLVAMVIASALPFPHSPVSRVAVATTEASSRPASLVPPPPNHSAPGTVLDLDPAPQEDPGSDVPSQGPTLRTEEPSKDRSGPDSRRQRPPSVDFPHPDALLDSATQTQPGPGPGPGSEPRAERRTADTSGTADPSSLAGTGPPLPPGLEEGNLDQEAGLALDGVFERDGMFLDAHPRVLFSTSASPPQHPPLLLLLESGLLEEEQEQEDEERRFEGHGDRAPDRAWSQVRRDKRSPLMDSRRGEKSVCESESSWVTNKSTGVDSRGNNVTVMMDFQTPKGPVKQFFYETRCRRAELRSSEGRSRGPAGTGVAGAGCLGVDKKQWVSECKVKQSFVRALIKDQNNRVAWRWIRIDSSCVCVLLSRANQLEGRELRARTGRG